MCMPAPEHPCGTGYAAFVSQTIHNIRSCLSAGATSGPNIRIGGRVCQLVEKCERVISRRVIAD
jgi:hypothetical protein